MAEPFFEKGSKGPCDPLSVQGHLHAAHPSVAHPQPDGHMMVSHSQPWMSVLRSVVLWASQPADQEERKTVARVSGNFSIFVQSMKSGQFRLIGFHGVVETFCQANNRFGAAQLRKGRVFWGRNVVFALAHVCFHASTVAGMKV